ncbi:MAG: phospholipase [Chitinophagaceae bacterium]|nr:phospholipase [Rubrivivax sp.]
MSRAGPALQVLAGPRARALMLERGLQAVDVRAIPAAAGGAKGLVLNPLDRMLFGSWLSAAPQTVHLLGASIGAWRMAAAMLPDADAALAQVAEDYITQDYQHRPGKAPSARHVSEVFGRKIEERLGRRAHELLAHPRWRLHVFTSHGRHLLRRQGRVRTAAGYIGAFVANAASRRALAGFLDRVVFADPRDPLPFPLTDFRTHRVTLTVGNLAPALLASCSIPFLLDAVHDIPGGPPGAYWDGGITDYHLHLDYAAMDQGPVPGWGGGPGLVLYPHFHSQVVPGWLDKAWKRRHRASPMLDNLVVLAPHPAWIQRLPGGKLPSRADFKTFGDDKAGRMRAWRRALAESQRLADEFAELVARGSPVHAHALT